MRGGEELNQPEVLAHNRVETACVTGQRKSCSKYTVDKRATSSSNLTACQGQGQVVESEE